VLYVSDIQILLVTGGGGRRGRGRRGRGRRGHVTTSSVSFASLLTDSGTITTFSSVDDPDPGSVQFDTRIRDKILWIVHLRAWISTSQNVYLSFSYRFTLFTTGLSTCIFTFTSKAHYIVRST